MNKSNIGFIGTGNMASAIIKGIHNTDVSKNINIFGFDTNKNKTYDLEPLNLNTLQSIEEIVKKCEYIFIAVKPQTFPEIMPEISKYIKENSIIVSIAAGISSEYIMSYIKKDIGIINVMPNTPIMVGNGASTISYSKNVLPYQLDLIKSIFLACGHVEIIDESKMNHSIPLHGSSPAFIYNLSKSFIQYAVESGINYDTALNLFCNTLIGAAKMMLISGKDIDSLINDVCSPGGTTIAGLDVFKNSDFDSIIKKACYKCCERAHQLQKKN